MSSIVHKIRLVAEAKEAIAQVRKYRDEIVGCAQTVKKHEATLSGDKLLRSANEYAAAIAKMGGATKDLATHEQLLAGAAKLSGAERARLNKLFAEAIEKYQALGEAVPSHLRQLQEATAQTHAHTTSWKSMVAGYVAGLATFETARMALGALKNFVLGSIEAYGRAEQASAKLRGALIAQGAATPTVIRQYENLQRSYQQTTTYSHEMIAASQVMLAQIGNVGPEMMDRALQASTNLAAALNIDLKDATTKVAKAAAGQTDSLRENGIVLDKTKLEAQGLSYVLDTLNAKFSGAATTAAQTYQGSLEQLKNEWTSLKEEFGKAVVGTVEYRFVAGGMKGAIQETTEDIKKKGLLRGLLEWINFTGIELSEPERDVFDVGRFTEDISLDRKKTPPSASALAAAAKATEGSRESWARAWNAYRKEAEAFAVLFNEMGAYTREKARTFLAQAHNVPIVPNVAFGSSVTRTLIAPGVSGGSGQMYGAAEAGAKSSWSGVLGSVLPTLQSAFTGGGGLGGALKAIGVGVNGGWGASVMQGALGKSLGKGITSLFGDKAGSLFGANAGAIGGVLGAGAGALGSWLSGKDNKAAKAAGGALSMMGTGAMIGSVIPGLGTAAGAAIGGAIGAIKGLFGKSKGKIEGEKADAEIQSLQTDLLKTYGSIEQIRKVGGKAGEALAAAWGDKNVAGLKHFQGLVDKFKESLDMQQEVSDLKAQLASLEAQQVPTWDKVKAAIDRYGGSVSTLGQQIQQLAITDAATQMINDWETLTTAGADANAVAAMMSGQLNQLVKDAAKYGSTLPENLKPALQALTDQGTLFDENGQQIRDLSTLKFGAPVKSELDVIKDAVKELVGKIGELVDKLNGVDGKKVTTEVTVQERHVKYIEEANGDERGNDAGHYAARGGYVTARGIRYLREGGNVLRWIPRGSDTVPAMLTPGEFVWSREAVQAVGTARVAAMHRAARERRSEYGDLLTGTYGAPRGGRSASGGPLIAADSFSQTIIVEIGGQTVGRATAKGLRKHARVMGAA